MKLFILFYFLNTQAAQHITPSKYYFPENTFSIKGGIGVILKDNNFTVIYPEICPIAIFYQKHGGNIEDVFTNDILNPKFSNMISFDIIDGYFVCAFIIHDIAEHEPGKYLFYEGGFYIDNILHYATPVLIIQDTELSITCNNEPVPIKNLIYIRFNITDNVIKQKHCNLTNKDKKTLPIIPYSIKQHNNKLNLIATGMVQLENFKQFFKFNFNNINSDIALAMNIYYMFNVVVFISLVSIVIYYKFLRYTNLQLTYLIH